MFPPDTFYGHESIKGHNKTHLEKKTIMRAVFVLPLLTTSSPSEHQQTYGFLTNTNRSKTVKQLFGFDICKTYIVFKLQKQ